VAREKQWRESRPHECADAKPSTGLSCATPEGERSGGRGRAAGEELAAGHVAGLVSERVAAAKPDVGGKNYIDARAIWLRVKERHRDSKRAPAATARATAPIGDSPCKTHQAAPPANENIFAAAIELNHPRPMNGRLIPRIKSPALRSRARRAGILPLILLAGLYPDAARGQSTWNTMTGTWNVDSNWTPVGVPINSTSTNLIFTAEGATSYTTTNDIGASAFTLNQLTVNNTGTGTVTIASATTSNTLFFGGETPTIDVTGTAIFTGLLSGASTIVKSGPGTFFHDSNNAGFTGTILVNAGTFVNRSSAVAVANFNPVSIVVNNGGTYQFGQSGAGDPNLPNATFITVNSGGTVSWQEGEVFGGFHLQGGVINLQANSTSSGAGGQNWTSGTLTGGNFNFAGNTAINKTSTNTVLVSGGIALNTATGGVNILEGTIVFANPVNLGTANINLGDNAGTTAGTFEYQGAIASKTGNFGINAGGGVIRVTDPTTVLTLTGAISGSGNLSKTGGGKLRLAGSLGGSGTATVSQGILQVEPVAALGNFTVAAAAVLAVNSGVGGLSFIAPGITLTDGSAALQFDLDTNAVPTAPLAVVNNADGLVFSGAPTLRLTNLQPFANGTFTLVDYNGAAIASGFNLALPGRTTGGLIYDTANTKIDVAISGTDTVKWTGSINGDWNVGTAPGVGGTNNWQLITAGTATNFINTDNITFDDTATTRVLNVTTVVQPASITVNAGANYTFAGAGKISGATALNKSGTGTLILATDNDYNGGTNVTAGILQLGNGGTAGSLVGPITLNNGALAFNHSDNFAFSNSVLIGANAGIIQNGSGTITMTSPIAAGANTVNIDGPGNLNLGATLSGTGIVNKEGAGTLTLLANNNTFTGALNVNAGTVLLEDLGAGGDLAATSIVLNDGGTFILGAAGNSDLANGTFLTINTGGLFRIEQGENFAGYTLNGGEFRYVSTVRTGVNFTGVAAAADAVVYDLRSGSITTDFTAPGGGGVLNQNNGGILAKTTSGTVTVSGSVTFQNSLAMQIREGTLAMGLVNLPATGTVPITLGGTLTAGTLQISGSGLATTSRQFTLDAGGGTIHLPDATGTVSMGGLISGAGSLTKTGPGTLVLGTGNDYLGNTVVAAGTLEVNNLSGSATGSGAVTIAGTLAGDGAISTGAGNGIVLNGIFQPGYTGATQGTDFSFATGAGGSAVFGAASVARFDLWNSTGSNQSAILAAADLLVLAGNIDITAGATLKLTNPNALTFQDGDVFRLFDWTNLGVRTGTWSIDSADLNLGALQLDTSNLYTAGTVAIVVPEPGCAWLAMTGLAGLGLRRRRVMPSQLPSARKH
jgi:autotransporter-associated beta strand protein